MLPPFQREEIRKISWDGRASTVRQHCLLPAVFSPASGLFVLGMVRKACLFLQRIRHLKQGKMTPRCHFCTQKGDSVLSPSENGSGPLQALRVQKEPQWQLVFAHTLPGDPILRAI